LRDRREYDDDGGRNGKTSDVDHTETKSKTVGKFGLIGTSLSDRDNNPQGRQNKDYLGPNQKLLAARREEMERERQSRLYEGRGGGRSRDERERALEEMERDARDRERRY
jgi:hypothetical protein